MHVRKRKDAEQSTQQEHEVLGTRSNLQADEETIKFQKCKHDKTKRRAGPLSVKPTAALRCAIARYTAMYWAQA